MNNLYNNSLNMNEPLIEKMRERVQAAEERALIAEARVRDLEALNATIYATLSWRITKPLRLVRTWLKKPSQAAVNFLHRHPMLRAQLLHWITKLGLYHITRAIYRRLLGRAPIHANQVTNLPCTKVEDLSASGHAIYGQLKRMP